MAARDGSMIRKTTRDLVLAALLCGTALATAWGQAFAQDIPVDASAIPSGSQMLIEADTLVYDNDNETVTAVGGVKIEYGGNRLVAEKVSYNRRTQRLTAIGGVELVDSTGTKVYADEIDVTDDFGTGFVNALRVETADKTYFAAESAQREGGVLTTFNRGVYTACEPCEDDPDKAPIWRIKARKIIWDGKAKTVRFENSRFEFFGFPIAYLPVLEVADPTVKRKSGFLIPGVSFKSDLGTGVLVPYYFALSPTFDATVTARYYAKQGFLAEGEWRQQFNNGAYSVKIAGIRQQDPDSFDAGGVNSGPTGDPNRLRGMVGTTGQFAINPRWTFGWDVLVQSDKNFSYTYDIGGYRQFVHTSQVYLTGLEGKNYFDLRAMRFEVQEDYLDTSTSARNDKQPWALPSFDYSRTSEEAIAGGEVTFDVNARMLRRDDLDYSVDQPAIPGLEGDNGRFTTEIGWKRSLITESGLIVTPLLSFRGDVAYTNASSAAVTAVNAMAADLGVASDLRTSFTRWMATAGLEMRWPLLFSGVTASHIIEPMAQVFVRPSEQYLGGLTVPNEDAQSFVFDATTLFEQDKFAGYDRVEGGTRLNAGFRYTGSYSNGWATNGLFGQSYHIAGDNSFAAPDLVNAGAFSGLETDTSDYVGLVGFTSPFGLSASASARLDEQTFQLRRTEVKAGFSTTPVSVTAKYAFIESQPLYGFPTDRHEVTLSASTRVREFWRVFASGTYDLQEDLVVRDSIGFSYDDECFTYTMTFAEDRDRDTRETSQSVGFNISFRTIGDFGSNSAGGFTTN